MLTGIGLTLSSDVAGEFKITMPERLEATSIIVSVVLLGVASGLELIDSSRDKKARASYYEVERLLLAMLHEISIASNIPLGELGSSAFRCSRLPSWGQPQRLVRAVRYRVAQNTSQSGVEWTVDKGVVGQAWRTRRAAHKDLTGLAGRYQADMTDAAINSIRKGTRDGFSNVEFRALVGKYAEVSATPVWHPTKDGVLVGVLTIDRIMPKNPAGPVAVVLGMRENLDQLELNARLLSPKLIAALRPMGK